MQVRKRILIGASRVRRPSSINRPIKTSDELPNKIPDEAPVSAPSNELPKEDVTEKRSETPKMTIELPSETPKMTIELPSETPKMTIEIPSENAFTFSLSTERFSYNFVDAETISSINQTNHMFTEFKRNPPTLEEALKTMGYDNYEELAVMFLGKAEEKLKELSSSGMTAEDVAAIFCYTFEWDGERFKGVKSPYNVLSNSLSVNRNTMTFRKTRAFLFLLLRALRKLPRDVPIDRTLYRGIRTHIQTEKDPEFPLRKPYAIGNTKTWWTFTSTTTDFDVAKAFIGQADKGTLFVLSGETWGYDISVFSDYPDEKEILLEPERKMDITNVSRDDKIINVNANILDTPLVLCDIIKAKKIVVIKDINKIKEIPVDLKVGIVTDTTVELSWSPVVNGKDVSYEVSVKKNNIGFFSRNADMHNTKETKYVVRNLEGWTEYLVCVRCGYDGAWGNWSERVAVKTEMESVWKKCPDRVDPGKKYVIDTRNARVATKAGGGVWCTIIENNSLLPNKVTSWSIKMMASRKNDCYGTFVGVAPSDIDQNAGNDNHEKCGWYFDCFDSALVSGPPHNYKYKKYGLRRENGQYVHAGDSVGVVMDTARGELSFALKGVNYGVAYKDVPLDKPLVSCVLLWWKDDSVKLDPSEVKENVNSFIPVPSNVTAEGITWDSIVVSWDAIEGATFYQVDMDGNKTWDASATNTFTKRGLLPGSEHIFRVRAVKGKLVGGWSTFTSGRTHKKMFESGWWKECDGSIDKDKRYYVGEKNPRIATKSDNGLCTVVWAAALPPGKVSTWSIKVLASKSNDGDGIFIGVAPTDIDQNNDHNLNKCGWYFGCCFSALFSGPPHRCKCNKYGQMKENGQYVRAGDSVGVIMDTASGELSFILDGVNYGIAYEGIPLDKPLVPCVILREKGDSIELDTSELKENVDSSIPVPSNITAKSKSWESIILEWDKVDGASLYQIEVDGGKLWGTSIANMFTNKGLLPNSVHNFRIRTVRKNGVSEWSGVVRGWTMDTPDISQCVWKKCPGYVDSKRGYSVSDYSPRIVTSSGEGLCTITGDIPLPHNKVASWNIRILNLGEGSVAPGIYVGVAPSDINQNDTDNFNKCGWYFDCYNSLLDSGPPHSYCRKGYGPWRGDGAYVRPGDTVSVVVDTTYGALSFVINGMNYGVAYGRVPLDKPLVPCVIFKRRGDSVEVYSFVAGAIKVAVENTRNIMLPAFYSY